ncbi:MAG: glutamate 5-kinase [Planctomycetota bacterium]|nr:MAG: glutamate 5-kinase [Planctomycetota bacterium]
MESAVRRAAFEAARTIVVKIGTNALSRPDDTLDLDRISSIADQLVRLRQTGKKVLVVSSGAIGAGIGLLGLKERPKELPHLQATASVGQAHLIGSYDDAFQRHGLRASQILLTANDFRRRVRYLNIRNTINTLFEYDVIPVVNENDTVSIDEIKFGDNDRLAAMVSSLLERPLLIILSVIDGLYDRDPKDPGAKVIPLVEHWDETLRGLAAETKSTRGTGGMVTKLEAVRMATSGGGHVIIANGTDRTVLDKVRESQEIGTLFLGSGEPVAAWKRWIGYTVTPVGKVRLDAGATKAVRDNGRSLLAIGVTGVEGHFSKGEIVSVLDPQGIEVARGLINFNSQQLAQIAGQRTAEIVRLLGADADKAVIHRDNLAVTGRSSDG